MSFAALKKNSKVQYKNLAEKMTQETKGAVSFEDTRMWTPDIDKTGSGFAVIRFLPAVDGESIPYVKTFNHGWRNANKKWFIENCPTTIGQTCPVCEANSELWNSNTKENQDIARNRKRKVRYISNILVLSDSKRPENEGKVFLFSYGTKIFQKIMGAIQPEFEDEVSYNPFDFWTGANFKLKIRNYEGFRNYDKSEFDAPKALFEDDEALENVWKSEYPLQEFLDPKQFKSYDELKKKLFAFLGNSAPVARATEENEPEEVEEVAEPAPRRAVESKPAAKPAKKEEPTDDDDFSLYESLLND